MKKRSSILIIIFLIIGNCTENPFIKNEISEDANRIFSGKIVVEDETDPSGVFVWLQELNLKTWTDKNGDFSFTLPSKPESQSGGGFTGFVTAYYYIANYKLEKSRLFVFDGSFKFGEADLNNKGQISETIILKKKLNIITKVSPDIIYSSYSSSIAFSANLTTLFGETIKVHTQKNRDGGWTGIYIRSRTDLNKETIRISKGRLREDLFTGEMTWEIEMAFPDLGLQPGSYEIIPYITILEDLPAGLLLAIGDNVVSYSDSYFKYPIRVETAILEIRE